MLSSFMAFSGREKISYSPEASEALGRDYWLLLEGFSFYIGKKGDDKWVHVPGGFLTDGASVPRILWSAIPPWGKYGQAVIVHDYLCEYLSITIAGKPVRISREYADLIFLEMLIVLDVPELERKSMYTAVCAYSITLGRDVPPSNTLEKRKVEAALAAVAA